MLANYCLWHLRAAALNTITDPFVQLTDSMLSLLQSNSIAEIPKRTDERLVGDMFMQSLSPTHQCNNNGQKPYALCCFSFSMSFLFMPEREYIECLCAATLLFRKLRMVAGVWDYITNNGMGARQGDVMPEVARVYGLLTLAQAEEITLQMGLSKRSPHDYLSKACFQRSCWPPKRLCTVFVSKHCRKSDCCSVQNCVSCVRCKRFCTYQRKEHDENEEFVCEALIYFSPIQPPPFQVASDIAAKYGEAAKTLAGAKQPRCEKLYYYLIMKSDIHMAYAYALYGAFLLDKVSTQLPQQS
jgi:hypothetical protein